MPTKQESIIGLAAQTARDITRSGGAYMAFLTTAANNFKYGFRDQLLIYAQKPEATACAEISFWNRHGRWVNKGTTGIALLKDTDAPYKLRYVFDMSDTNSRAGRTVPVWRMQPRDEGAVIESLENRYGIPQGGGGLTASLLETAKTVTEDNAADYLTALCEVKGGSLLEELDADNTEVWFKSLLENSVAYMLLTRCGLDAGKVFSDRDFARVFDFDTPETVSILGTAVSDISEMVLREIAATVMDRRRQEIRGRDRDAEEPDTGRNEIEQTQNPERSTAAEALSQRPSIREMYDRCKLVILGAVLTDEAYRNACRNSDRETALLEGAAAIRRAVLNSRDTQLMKLYYDMASFHNRIHREVLDETYPALSAAPQKEAEAEAWSYEEDERPPWGIEPGSHSPWGKVQICREIADGVFEISTARHGGIMLRESDADGLFSSELIARAGKEYGWLFFEEDEKAPIAAQQLRDRGFLRGTDQQRQEIRERDSVAKQEKTPYAENRKQTPERSDEDGTDLSQRGRLPSAQPDRTRDPGAGQVRDAAAQLSAGASERDLHRDAAFGQAGRAPRGDRPAGPRDGGKPDAADGSAAGRDGGAESVGSDGMGRADEQHPGGGRGNRAGGTGLQLTDPLPTEEEQKQEIARAEDKQSSAFVVPKEYRFSLGDTIHLGTQEYSLIAFDEKTVRLYDPTFPLINKEMERAEFDRMLAENPQNDSLAYAVEDIPEPADTKTPEEPTPPQENKALAEAKRLINVYCQQEFGQDADDSDLSHIDLAFTTTSDSDLPIEVSADLVHFRLVYQVNGQDAVTLQCHDLDDLNQHLANLDFDEMTAYAEEQYHKQQNNDKPPERPQEPEQQTPTPSESSRVDEMLRQAELANRLYEQTGQAVFGFEASRSQPVNLPQPLPPAIQPGTELTLDGRRFVVDSVDETANAVSLRDMSFQNGTGFPIFRSEHIETVRRALAEAEKEPEPVKLRSVVIDLTPRSDREQDKEPDREPGPSAPPMPRPREKLPPLLLHPEIPSAGRHDYRITDEHLGEGGEKTKFKNNLAAIQTLQQIEAENRLATPQEQEILARYVGWGGLPQAFDEKNAAWSNEYTQLRAALTEEEYNAARASTLNAHYTSPVVIRAIYKAVENLGFRTGNILEPSCGIGNFFGLVPESMAESKLYGVELDPITGRIARQLYQNASIAVQGFEKTELPDSFFDLAIGNVPFGNYTLPDKRYDKNHFLIHDYFFARSLDKVRPGGIIAFVTSKGTLDKANPSVRRYIAQRADLLGAVRLPNNAFLANAGTSVTTDILFLQKRDRLTAIDPEWVHLGKTETGVPINQYFLDHPEMVLGEMAFDEMMYGNRSETTCQPFEGKDLKALLDAAIENIRGQIREYTLNDPEAADEDRSIPADPSVRNFSYTIVDGKLYYRENSRMNPVEVSVTAENRIRELVGLRDCVRTLIEYQTEDWSDDAIRAKQRELNTRYDAFVKRYGRITSRANKSAFEDDSAYFLLSSLEVLDDDGNFVRKADMFSKRTIRQRVEITHVDTASEALAVSLAEKACVDLGYMASLMGGSEAISQIVQDLNGVIFKDPATGPFDLESGGEHWARGWQTADEYLSGNVRKKLKEARLGAETDPFFKANVQALEQAQPPDLTVGEISVRLGATWIPPEDVEQFVYELFGTPKYTRWKIRVHYSKYTGEWNVEGKSADKGNIRAYNTYGTGRINGYKIVEEALNLRDVRIFDYDENRNPVLNKKETAIAQGKQALIKQAFLDWIWKDPARRERLCRLYNDTFNSTRPREYDGSHIRFVGMNPEITLRKHQINAIAHILYGGNTLLAHCVGGGKTYEMTAAAQESKRLGLCQKSLFVVPNHLTEQWAAEYLQLYPAANILVATKKDFETKNRKRFCGRIATGDYDAIIIGHSQFEKIPMSMERQTAILEQQKGELIKGIDELKRNHGERFSIKQMEKSRKSIEAKLAKLNDQSRKDDVVTFEELGVDRLFVDEAHYYKNLAAFSKMRNVGGISQTEAQKSSDLYMKCRYLDELTGDRGVVFATGTPISNTMVEMYTMQKYLQYDTLKEHGLLHFDAWASTFGETVTAIELAPEGTGYRAKTRFARFYNLPELMAMFKEVADVQTADMLKLPVPKANFHNVVLKPSEQQKEMVAALGERAERVRNRMVDPSEDNMLNITNDGRKLALDQRLINPLLPDSDTSKVNACAENVFEIWQRTADQRSAQMVFCDLSTPGKSRPIEMVENEDGSFEAASFQNVYDDLRNKLIAKGIPAEEIAFIHSAGTEAKKKELFGKVRSGQIRVLLGSTQKMGAGTNCQQRLIALHHLDIGWRPADIQQREGRIIRQGNSNPEVDLYTYVTEGTFDAYMFQMVEAKQKFIGQIMTSKSPARSAEDVDETALSYAEIKALCTGNPHIKEKMDLDIEVQRLKLLKGAHLSQKYALEDQILKELPQKIASYEQRITGYTADMECLARNTQPNKDDFSPMEIEGTVYTEKKDAGSAILAACKAMTSPDPVPLGRYRGFDMELSFDSFGRVYRIALKGSLSYSTDLGTDIFGNIQRLDNVLGSMGERLTACKQELENTKAQLANAKEEVEKPFAQEEELKTKSARLEELNILLNLDKRENEIMDEGRDEDAAPPPPRRTSEDRER